MENNNMEMENDYSEFYEKLARLQWLLHRRHLQQTLEYGPFADPTRGQGRVLAMLKIQPEISTKDMSYLLGIRVQSLNELLNKLGKTGLVTREPSESDRRVLMVKLTEKGKEEQSGNADFSGIFDCLNAEEQAAFADYLDRVIAALENQVGAEDGEEMESWMKAARERMGDERFDHIMAMRGGFGRGRHGFGPDGPGPDPRHGPGHRHGHGPLHDPERGFGPEGRGPAPEHMPGAERFSPDYDDPMPDERK